MKICESCLRTLKGSDIQCPHCHSIRIRQLHFFKYIERFLRRTLRWDKIALEKISRNTEEIPLIKSLFDMTIFYQGRQLQLQSPNPLNAFGKKCFSQADEDGITLEILRRIGCLASGSYTEFGVGDGIENNTIILAALGWKGFWVGGEDLKPKLPDNKHFTYLKNWITLENIADLTNAGLKKIECGNLDLISLDLDGNDIYFVESLLSMGLRPKLFIAEYNAKFPPPIDFKIEYNADHQWKLDDYYGASLTSFEKLFAKYKYKLVCCNALTGVNAFFIDERFSEYFLDVPAEIDSIYMPPRFWLYKQFGHQSSLKTIESIFMGLGRSQG